MLKKCQKRIEKKLDKPRRIGLGNQFYLSNRIGMEKLLNKLIEKGWKPRNKDYLIRLYVKYGDIQLRRGESYAPTEEKRWAIMSKRELVSMESGLRQFVCQNDMVDKKKIGIYYEMFLEENGIDAKNYRPFSLVERLIIESSLKKESELEDFLLSNINVDGTTK